MICFVTGPVGSGKTTALRRLYRGIARGDGFYNLRRYNENGLAVGQDLVRLSGEETVPFCRVDDCIPPGWCEAARYRNHSFSETGLRFTEGITESILSSGGPAFIDELGPLELSGGGILRGTLRLIRGGIPVFAVCRDSCLVEMIKLLRKNGADHQRILVIG